MGREKFLILVFDVLSQDVESSKTPSSSPRLSGFCGSPSLVHTGKKVEEVDARALRQLDLCFRVHAKIASTLSGPVCSVSSGTGLMGAQMFLAALASLPCLNMRLWTLRMRLQMRNEGIVGLHVVNESGSFMTEAVVASVTAGESKDIVGLHAVNESDCFMAEAAVAAATPGECEGTI